MKLKKLVSICLVGAMAATLLAGCGSSDETVGEEIKDDAEEVVEDVKDVAEDVGEGVEDAVEDVGEDIKDAAEEAVDDVKENAEEAKDEVSFEGFENLITIVGYGMTLYTNDGVDEVVDAINEISIPAINVQLEYNVLDSAAYPELVGLMYSGGESFDLVMMPPSSTTRYTVMVSQNELMDISDLVYEYAAEAMEFLEPYISPFMLDGALYGLPGYRILNSDCYVIMRKDILDYLGLTEQAEAISSWSDLEAIFEAVDAAQDELPEDLQTTCMISNTSDLGTIIPYTGYYNMGDDFSEHYGTDNLAESNSMIYVDENDQVQSAFGSENYKAIIDRCRQWYLNGWVYKDAANNFDNGDVALKNGQCFCIIKGSDAAGSSESGTAAAMKQSTGRDVICINCCKGLVSSNSATFLAWGVPVTSDEPEAAVAFLNLMYTNADIMNLFVYGIEGRDYELNDEGEAVILEDGLYQASDWMYPNEFLAYPGEGQGGDFREVTLESSMNAEFSKYYGFAVDTDPLSNEVMALSSVKEQYLPGLNSGTLDSADYYDDFMEALDDAGLQTVIDYYQEALDEWLANNK